MHGRVELQRDGGVAVVCMRRAQALNALDVPTAQAFRDICRTLVHAPDVRAVVLRGEGKAFGVGGDLAALRDAPDATALELIECMHEGVRILAGLNAPIIASVQGVVAGGSLSLSLACDLAVAAQGTRFNLAYVNVAASSDVSASWNLPRMVGLRRAMQIALLSETFDAQEALALGIVNQVVPAERLEEVTLALAHRLAAGPTLAYGRMKRLLRQSFARDLDRQLDDERDAFRVSVGTDDFREALDAFFGKRQAIFAGR